MTWAIRTDGFMNCVYPRWTRDNTVFQGILGCWQRYPRCRASARLPRLPCQQPNLLQKNSIRSASEKKPALARKRTTVGCRPPRTMTPPALILAAGRRVVPCPPRVFSAIITSVFHFVITEQLQTTGKFLPFEKSKIKTAFSVYFLFSSLYD